MPDEAVPSPRGARRTSVPTIQLPVDLLSAHGVEIVDTPEVRVHHPSDLLNAVLCTLAIALMMLLAVYAHGTTTGVTADVRNVATVLRSILIVPIAVLEGLVTLILPATVLIELSARRLWRQVLESLAAGFVGLLVGALLTWGIVTFGSAELVRGMSVFLNGRWTVTVPGYMSAIAGLVTAAGSRARRRTVAWSWNVLWVALGVVLITGQVSLTGAAIAVLAGRLAGLGVRYVSGVQSERAYGAALVAGIRRAGFEPVRLSRVRDGEHADRIDDVSAALDVSALATPRLGGNRVYEMTASGDRLLEVVVMDGDRQVIGVLSRLWRSLRMRGIDGRTVVSLRQAAERAALLAYAARAAGVRTPQLLAVAEADASMLFVQEHPEGAVPLSELAPEQITDTVLQAVWDQVRLAHAAGIAHRALTSEAVLVRDPMTATPEVWITGWDSGDVASSDLARRMDLTQMVAMLAVRVGARRALASATAILPSSDIASIGPLLQTIALPRRTRDEIRAQKRVLAELRAALVEQLPEASIEPERLVRLGARAVLTVLLTSVAVVVVLTSVNVSQISQALAHSDWRWSVVAFALGLVTLVGAALTLVAFSPVKLPLWRTILVQTAATFIALAAPAGVGPAALNMRMLTRRGVTASLAVATVALVQVSQFVVTIALLVILSIASGTNEAAKFAPTTTTLVAVAIVVVLVASAFLVPRVRRWVAARTVPTLQQTWPRLIEIVGQPGRLALGFTGNVVMTMGYVFALESALAAFGQNLSLVQVAVIYLGGNAA
ncbi:MAG: lysylphosphatidylglycerol synthase domain-containing protein, partial [Cellulomonas sp.]